MSFHFDGIFVPVSEEDLKSWIESFYDADEDDGKRNYELCTVIDELLLKTYEVENPEFWFEKVNYILEVVDLERIPLTYQIGLLSFSNAAKSNLSAYKKCLQKVRELLCKQYSEEATDLFLKGL